MTTNIKYGEKPVYFEAKFLDTKDTFIAVRDYYNEISGYYYDTENQLVLLAVNGDRIHVTHNTAENY